MALLGYDIQPASLLSSKLISAGCNVFWSVLWVAGPSLILLYPLRWLFGDTLRPVRMVSYITPWLLTVSIPLLVIAGLRHRKWLSFVQKK